MWIGVRQRFGRFHRALMLTTEEQEDGLRKQHGVRKSLERAYYDRSTEFPPGFIVGSWGKGTAVRPPTDIDVFFELPPAIYHRFEAYTGNKQSALLQEVRDHLLTRSEEHTSELQSLMRISYAVFCLKKKKKKTNHKRSITSQTQQKRLEIESLT